ncbi:MAG TPA: PD-(D/E)XK nuclease-like domain-containing protein [Pirellulales bacterium]
MSEYRSRRREYLTSHQLADFRKCPKLFYLKRSGLVGDADSREYFIGRAVHTLTLEGQAAFDAEYCVGGPINPKTGKVYGSDTQKFAEWAAEQRKPVITDSQYGLACRINAAVKSHDEAAELLASGQAEAVVRDKFFETKAQIRIDWYADRLNTIVDLKTCFDLDQFAADAKKYGYGHQLAFYRRVFLSRSGYSDWPEVKIIAVEKCEPFRVGVFRLRNLEFCDWDNQRAVLELQQCEKFSSWPTRYEGERDLSFAEDDYGLE